MQIAQRSRQDDMLLDLLFDTLDAPETRWIAGFLVAVLVAGGAWKLRALTRSGFLAATAIGATIVATAGWWPGLILVAFFVTASALSMWSARRPPETTQARGKQRDAVQVFANGGIPALLAVASVLAVDPAPWLVALAASVAGATSDTWGTETGRLSRSQPRVVTTWRPALAGTSGAISTVGTLGSFGGAFLIGAVVTLGIAVGWSVDGLSGFSVLLIVTLAGFGGSLIDSLLGATLQASYRCPSCNETTERQVHTCGIPTERIESNRERHSIRLDVVAPSRTQRAPDSWPTATGDVSTLHPVWV